MLSMAYLPSAEKEVVTGMVTATPMGMGTVMAMDMGTDMAMDMDTPATTMRKKYADVELETIQWVGLV